MEDSHQGIRRPPANRPAHQFFVALLFGCLRWFHINSHAPGGTTKNEKGSQAEGSRIQAKGKEVKPLKRDPESSNPSLAFSLSLLFFRHQILNLQSQAVQPDKPLGVFLPVNLIGLEGGEILPVKGKVGFPSRHAGLAFIELQPDQAGHLFWDSSIRRCNSSRSGENQ